MNMKMMTPKDIELLARRNAVRSRLERQAGITHSSLFWNKAPQSERPRDFNPIAAQRRRNFMLHNAVSSLDCDTADRALLMGKRAGKGRILHFDDSVTQTAWPTV